MIDKDYKNLVSFLKFEDPETCVNVLFVLSNSEEDLEPLMSRLDISRKTLVTSMLSVLGHTLRSA